MFRGAWLRAAVKKILRRFVVVIRFEWPSSGEVQVYRVRPLRRDEIVVLIWSFYGSKLSNKQIKAVLEKMGGTSQAEIKNIQAAVDHCESVVDRMDASWGPLVSRLLH